MISYIVVAVVAVAAIFLYSLFKIDIQKRANLLAIPLFLVGLIINAIALQSLGSTVHLTLDLPFYLGLAPFQILIDNLSAFFLLILGTVSSAVAIYIPGYLKREKDNVSSNSFWLNSYIFILSMALVLVSANALTYIVFWELMSLSSGLLVANNLKSRSVRRASLIYLAATRIATTLIVISFIYFGTTFHSWNFSDWQVGTSQSLAASLALLLGLSIKAGLWPFHIWLPYAHPAAPSPSSALMSGVMIKIALYSIIRFFVLDANPSLWIPCTLLGLSLVSAFWGALFSYMQTDLKRVLAFSSVENIGIIGIGLSISMFGKAMNLESVYILGLAAAIFHCINHGFFKSLLFLCAGTIDSAVHTRDLSKLGGLARKMPATLMIFLLGAASISSIPPFNGFASKWLIYQSAFKALVESSHEITVLILVLTIAVMAMVSALTLASYTRVLGTIFSGRPRTPSIKHAAEATKSMLLAKSILAGLCLFLGLMSPAILEVLYRSFTLSTSSPSGTSPATVPELPLLNIFLFLITAILILLTFKSIKPEEQTETAGDLWDCGYGPLSERMQLSADSFSETIGSCFAPVLLYKKSTTIEGRDKRHFPTAISATDSTKSLLEKFVYVPAVSIMIQFGKSLARLQAGSVHMYLLYVFISLLGLLLAGAMI